MAARIDDAGRLADAFAREDRRARAKAGRLIGRQIVKEHRARVGRVYADPSPRFVKATKAVVAKRDGTLLLLHTTPFSNALEDGATITPKRGRYLAVSTGLNFAGGGRKSLAALRAAGETFVVRAKSGALLVMRRLAGASAGRQALAAREGRISGRGRGRAFPVAVLLARVRVPARLGLARIVRAKLDAYVEAYEKALIDGR